MLLLNSLIALDALHRGKATKGLLTLLGQQLLMSEALCLAGYEQACLQPVREGHAALVSVDWEAASKSAPCATGAEYQALREALIIYDVQLQSAPRADVEDAQLATLSRLVRHLKGKKADISSRLRSELDCHRATHGLSNVASREHAEARNGCWTNRQQCLRTPACVSFAYT